MNPVQVSVQENEAIWWRQSRAISDTVESMIGAMEAIVRAPPTATELSNNDNLFAAIDMGTNSFKLLIFRAYPDGIFFPVRRLKHAVVLGRDSALRAISADSQARALDSLRTFTEVLRSHNVAPSHTRCLATSAIREAENRDELLIGAKEVLGLGFDIDVLSGEEEAALAYRGAIQFLSISHELVLNVDIGGGSTEFTVGKQGRVLYCTSLKLGHVNLTLEFAIDAELSKIRAKIRSVIEESCLIDNIRTYGFNVAVGSSGTIRAIEKAASHGFSGGNQGQRQWRLKKSELLNVIEELGYGGEEGKARRDQFFGSRSEFIVAGAVLLGEIFEVLGVEEMEVSKYALGEAAIADTVSRVYGSGRGLGANSQWQSVIRLATRLNSEKRSRDAVQCASVAKEIFEGVTKHGEFVVGMKDLEYLEAACLLHNIGLFNGRKGYHKHSYHMIMNSDQLCGYELDEIKFIALLAKHHRKKFPKPNHASLKELPEQLCRKFRYLCSIIRVASAVQQHLFDNSSDVRLFLVDRRYELICGSVKDHDEQHKVLCSSEEPYTELARELSIFKEVFNQELIVQLPCRGSEP